MLTSPAEEAALTATRTVLVVDDEPAMRTALTESLRRRGYVVLQAVDGRDALDRLDDAKPWLVLTDMKMPKLGGIALVREIKKRTPQTHVVVMTAFGSVETAVEAIKLGASDFLLKPFATDVLERVVSGLPGAGRDVTAPEGPRLASTAVRNKIVRRAMALVTATAKTEQGRKGETHHGSGGLDRAGRS